MGQAKYNQNQPTDEKFSFRVAIDSEAWLSVMQLKRKPCDWKFDCHILSMLYPMVLKLGNILEWIIKGC